ncbi:MAG: hypothetical protein ACREUE_00415 [Panacagrimonas sp.]
MKRKPPPSDRDPTGLACTVGMGLLVLLAWATLPGLSAPDGIQGTRVGEIVSLVTPPALDSHANDPIIDRIAAGRK